MARTRIHGQQVTDGSIELVDLSSALASTITGKADAGNLAPVATSGSYNDLSDLPTLFSGAYADLTGKPTLFSGDYADLSNKPSLFDGNYSSLSGAPVLSTVATSGSYNDLSNLPTLFSGSYTDLTNKPILFSGSYNDLSDKPSIPSIAGLASETYVDTKVADLVASAPAVLDTLNELAAALGDDANFATTVAGQIGDVASDVSALDTRVTAVEGDVATLQTDVAAKADSASLAAVATSGSYNDLSNLPTLFSGAYADLSGKPTLFSGAYADLTGKPTLFSGSYNDLTDKPTFSSDLDGLTDVAITSPSADQVLKYNGTSWVNATAPATFSGSYTDLTNKPTLASFTTLTSPASGQFLKYNGSNWVNSAISASDLPVASNSGSGIVDTGFQIFAGDKRFNGIIQAYGRIDCKSNAINQPAMWISPVSASHSINTPLVSLSNGTSQTLGISHQGTIDIALGAATSKGVVIKGAASQTANLFEVQNSSGTVLASVSATGDGFFTSSSAANIPLTITRPASATNHALVVRDSSGNRLFAVMNNGAATSPIAGLGGAIEIGSSVYNMTTLGYHTSSNSLRVVSPSDTALGLQTADGGAGVYTMIFARDTTAQGWTVTPNNSVFPSHLNIAAKLGVNLASGIAPSGAAHINAGTASTKGLIVKGAASQTANLFEAQNSSGTALFSIDKDGSMAAGSVPVARVTGLHAVATSGSYNDLSDKPSIPSIAGLATETYVDTAVAAVVNSAPAVLDTLNELAAALNDDPNFATTMTTALAAKADSSSLAAVATSGSYVDLSNKPTIYTPVKEVFTALVDGTETVFVLADAPAVAGTEQVFVNGILQSAGASDDYTISGDTITFNTAPEAGWKLIVYYFV